MDNPFIELPDDYTDYEILLQCDEVLPLGLESISIGTVISDYMMSLVLRTSRNIVNSVSGQKTFPLNEFADRHRSTLPRILSGRGLTIDTNIMPCPPGMMTTYITTAKNLLSVYNDGHFEQIVQTLNELQRGILRNDRIALMELDQTLSKFPDTKELLDKVHALYKTNGLAYRPAKDLFASTTDINLICSNVKQMHLCIQDLSKMAVVVSRVRNTRPKTDLDKDVHALATKIIRRVAGSCTLAYLVLEKMMGLEHNFVRCLEVFYRQLKQA